MGSDKCCAGCGLEDELMDFGFTNCRDIVWCKACGTVMEFHNRKPDNRGPSYPTNVYKPGLLFSEKVRISLQSKGRS